MSYQMNGLFNKQVLVPLYKLLEFYSELTKQATKLI